MMRRWSWEPWHGDFPLRAALANRVSPQYDTIDAPAIVDTARLQGGKRRVVNTDHQRIRGMIGEVHRRTLFSPRHGCLDHQAKDE